MELYGRFSSGARCGILSQGENSDEVLSDYQALSCLSDDYLVFGYDIGHGFCVAILRAEAS